jgi:hypothetical protein
VAENAMGLPLGVGNGRITEIQPYHFDTAYVIEALSVD